MFTIYGKPNCPFCVKAEALLKERKTAFKYIDLENDKESLKWIKDQGFKTVPQIFNENNKHIGGYTELKEYQQ